MGEFVVWCSPEPIPPGVRSRWRWPVAEQLGVRGEAGVGENRKTEDVVVCIGRGHGRRGRRRFVSPAHQAGRLAAELPTAGAGGLDRYLGPVAGAVVSPRADETLVWRDRFGRHPIQMVRVGAGWVVTSCPQLAWRLSDGEPRWSLVSAFLHGNTTTTDADVCEDLYRIRPAELVRFAKCRVESRRFWWVPKPQQLDGASCRFRGLLEQFGQLYGSTAHTLALSAGLDSAVLAAFLTRHHPDSTAVTFSDPGAPVDEAPDAETTANRLGIQWRRFAITSHWPLSRPEDHRFPLAWGPPAHPDFAWKMPWHRWMSRRGRHTPVVYGNGADEALWVPRPTWFDSRWCRRDWSELFEAWRHGESRRCLRAGVRAVLGAARRPALRSMLPDWPNSPPPWRCTTRWVPPAGSTHPRTDEADPQRRFLALRRRRLRSWRWERAMRSLAVESRRTRRAVWTPFLDAEFWELSLSLSPERLVQRGRQKTVLRSAGGDLLGEACRNRPKTGGFDPVVERGLAGREAGRVHRLIARSHLADAWEDFDAVRFATAYEAYRHRWRRVAGEDCLGSWAVWKTLATELWLRRRAVRSTTRCATVTEVRP